MSGAVDRERIADVLDDAADAIEQRGWTQGNAGWGDPEISDDDGLPGAPDGPLCVEGGLCAALDVIPSEHGLHWLGSLPAFEALAEHLNVPAACLWDWNDAKGRTEQEVLDVLRAAAKQQRAAHPRSP